MPKGSVPKREAKKPKKSQERKIIAPAIVTSEGVEVIGKRRRRKEEDQ